MIKIENYEVVGWEHAIRGMRNPMNSWEKSDTARNWQPVDCFELFDKDNIGFDDEYMNIHKIGPNDLKLMKKLAGAGSVHGKYRRMITVYLDVTAPLYLWKEFDTYKVGTVANSCSTMHKLTAKEFTMDDFSHEDLLHAAAVNLSLTIDTLNSYRETYIHGGEQYDAHGNWTRYEPKSEVIWRQMIQLLPTSYNQKRTVMLNYEVLANIYRYRKDHKLDEWREFCKWIEKLPYSELITCNSKEDE